ncbi:riboflavin synthase [Lacrimispora indolis]|uniref:riboflavin synthase n=1 Tax=Lacrimispora indolis TaxID=69825 RepID=UPI00042208DB|nr:MULTISPECIES: riboflavin synthase [Lachnospiraceae]
MFTGIIEETGTVRNIKKGANSAVLTIGAASVLKDMKLGDSIAVNGICLTVTSYTSTGFTADVMHETIQRSSLNSLHSGAMVNLERAMPADGRFGGHIVTGHIDGTGVIRWIKRDDNAVWYNIRATPEILRYIVEKGSIAVDGISLTVAKVSDVDFSISVIPHTANHTTLAGKRVGDTVNLENDCVGKYIEKFLGKPAQPTKLSKGFLTEAGY